VRDRIVDVTVRCRLHADSAADYRYALEALLRPGRPMLDGSSYGLDGSYSIRPIAAVRVRPWTERRPITQKRLPTSKAKRPPSSSKPKNARAAARAERERSGACGSCDAFHGRVIGLCPRDPDRAVQPTTPACGQWAAGAGRTET
jgi:hypothetical protein